MCLLKNVNSAFLVIIISFHPPSDPSIPTRFHSHPSCLLICSTFSTRAGTINCKKIKKIGCLSPNKTVHKFSLTDVTFWNKFPFV